MSRKRFGRGRKKKPFQTEDLKHGSLRNMACCMLGSWVWLTCGRVMGGETKRQEITGQDQITEGLAEQAKKFGLCLMDFREPIKSY